MTRKIIFIFLGIILSSSFCFAAETVTITTYYPAPYGVYNVLRLNPHDNYTPGAACTNRGEMYYDNSDSQVYICNGTWQASGGGSFWRANAITPTNIENTNTGNVVLYSGGERFLHQTGTANTFIGYRAGSFSVAGDYNTSLGQGTLSVVSSGEYNIAIGNDALNDNNTGTHNVAIGAWALPLNINGVQNIAVGGDAGRMLTGGSNNVLVGKGAGYNLTTGNNNVFIGYQAGYNAAVGTNDRLYIANSSTNTPLIYGNFPDYLVGIGTSNPQSTLHVPDGRYAQFQDNNAGPPLASDCDNDAERGRLSIDTTNNRLYICNGAARGWDYVALTN